MKRLVVWGGGTGLESHRHIHRSFYNTAVKLGIEAKWIYDEPNGFRFEDGDTVIAADIWNKYLPYQSNVDYVLHNFNADHPVIQQADPDRILRLQVWTTDAFGESWDLYRQYDRESRILFQPWGTDLMANEFLKPVYNPHSMNVVFVGSVWSDTGPGVELGNKEAIGELDDACRARGLNLLTYTQIPDAQMIDIVRSARLAPTVVGAWQVEHGYLPCRAFKHASYGLPVITNSPTVAHLFNHAEDAQSIGDLIDSWLGISEADYLAAVKEDQETAKRYTYRESLASIERALTEGRDGPKDGPFLDWRTHGRMPPSIRADRAEMFMGVLSENKDLMKEAAEFLDRDPDQILLLRALVNELNAAVSFVDEDKNQRIVDTLERGKDFLRNRETYASTVIAQQLRDSAARIESALG